MTASCLARRGALPEQHPFKDPWPRKQEACTIRVRRSAESPQLKWGRLLWPRGRGECEKKHACQNFSHVGSQPRRRDMEVSRRVSTAKEVPRFIVSANFPKPTNFSELVTRLGQYFFGRTPWAFRDQRMRVPDQSGYKKKLSIHSNISKKRNAYPLK